jgi:hypothetical protein
MCFCQHFWQPPPVDATLGMSAKTAFSATAVVGLSGVICDPLGGWLSDRFGRKPVMILPWLVLALTVFPAFVLLDRLRSGAALYGACPVLGSISTLSSATIIVAITEALPARVRSGGIAPIYAFAISVFGGSAQFTVGRTSIRPHVITLADADAVVPQDGVSGGDMKEKLRQAIVGEIGLTRQFLLFRRARAQHNLLRFTALELGRIHTLQEFQGTRQ